MEKESRMEPKKENQSKTQLSACFKGSFILSARCPVFRQPEGNYKVVSKIPPQMFQQPEYRGHFTLFSRN